MEGLSYPGRKTGFYSDGRAKALKAFQQVYVLEKLLFRIDWGCAFGKWGVGRKGRKRRVESVAVRQDENAKQVSTKKDGEEGTNIRNNKEEGTTGEFRVSMALYGPIPQCCCQNQQTDFFFFLYSFGSLGSGWRTQIISVLLGLSYSSLTEGWRTRFQGGSHPWLMGQYGLSVGLRG